MNLSKAVEGYLFDKSATYSPCTVESYRHVFKHVITYLGDPELAVVSADDLKRFLLWLRTDYIPNRFNGDTSPLTPAAVDLHWKGIRSFFRWAHEHLAIARPDMDLPRQSFDRPRVVPFTEQEVRALLNAAEWLKTQKKDGRPYRQRLPTAYRNKALILFLLDTGVRLGEALRVQLKDVNFEVGEILIAPFGTGKKTKPRMVILGNTAKRALWLYVARLQDSQPQDRLFPMSPVAVRLMLTKLGQRAGVAHVHPHRFRHSFAIWYLRGGGDIFTLQRLLGHRDTDSVNYYLDIAQSDLAMAHKRASAVDRWNANLPI